jgi:hypothetical protein
VDLPAVNAFFEFLLRGGRQAERKADVDWFGSVYLICGVDNQAMRGGAGPGVEGSGMTLFGNIFLCGILMSPSALSLRYETVLLK